MSLFRKLPKVDGVLAHPDVAKLPHDVAVASIRQVLDGLRLAISNGELDAIPDIVPMVLDASVILTRGRMRKVINATGVVVHTNLGRAPWAPEAIDAAVSVAQGYCNLEMDLDTGKRGGRLDGIRALTRHLTGCEDALVVNNCASAVLLALSAFAAQKEVIVSRGELVEIGGSYRVPDVIQAGGARLVEVGTTNRTRVADYASAITEETALLLKVHHSNFRIVGFTEEASLEELVALGQRRGLPVVQDLGSGGIVDVCGEPTVADCVRSGVDIVLFSGDKLMGGPQAGLAVGRRDLIQRMRNHPLYRALRVGKVTLAALEATLSLYANGHTPPAVQMIERSPAEIQQAADQLILALQAEGIPAQGIASSGFVGGGAIPETEIPSYVVRLRPDSISGLAQALRDGEPSVVGRIHEDSLHLDLRTVSLEEVPLLAKCVARSWQTA